MMRSPLTFRVSSVFGWVMVGIGLVDGHPLAARAADPAIYSDRPNAVAFPPQRAKFVRFVIHGSTGGQPCIDELEVFANKGTDNLALAERGAKPEASSCLSGYHQHAIAHLNDGRYGNEFSWISAGESDEWAQIELAEPAEIAKVVFSRDRDRQYADRVPIRFEIQLSMDGLEWTTVRRVESRAGEVALHRPGGPGNLPPPAPSPVPLEHAVASSDALSDGMLREALLGEEHAWLKVHGHADLSDRLIPYNGRVQEYPRRLAEDRVSLPTFASPPSLDGRIDDACWKSASRGVARVAHPLDFDVGPLVESAVLAGHHGDDLYLAITVNRLLSSHVAVISSATGADMGLLRIDGDRLVFERYAAGGGVERSEPIDGAWNADYTCIEARIPLGFFDGCRETGLRIGLGLGGRHTPIRGQGVSFTRFSRIAVAQVGPAIRGVFQVRISAAPGGGPITCALSAPGVDRTVVLAAGESIDIAVEGQGAIGPEAAFAVRTDEGDDCEIHLFRYDPLFRALTSFEEMIERFARQGHDVAVERREWTALFERHAALCAAPVPDPAAERLAFLDARRAKRKLFFREPGLTSIENILFVKRHAFEPSHNYSDLLDAPYRPGGGVFVLRIPRVDGRLDPDRARADRLFESGGGIARDPAASFDGKKVYFGYRPSPDGYFHIMEMRSDGGMPRPLTDGPFHDYWPCPLPDGGLAMISTRCKARFICWRPQAAVLFRMDADGNDVRPLSYANLTEWGPSVMNDGRIIWQRSEYIDKGADFSHTLWAIRPDGSHPELVFGNDIIQPNGFANGREVPGTGEFLCTLISHFGDLNGPLALVDPGQSRFSDRAITTLTPEVPWPGNWPREECFRDGVPLTRDCFLCAHAPRDQFGLCVLDRFGNREMLYLDSEIGSMCPTPLMPRPIPPALESKFADEETPGELFVADVYRGIEEQVPRGTIKFLRISQEIRADLDRMPDGTYRYDHPEFQDWYATPIHKVSGPFGWPSYVAKGTLGLVPVEEDGSARFLVPPGKVLYLHALDARLHEVQRMRSVVQLQPGEKRGCIGCHESRSAAPPTRAPLALLHPPREVEGPSWGAGPFAYETVVQPVWNERCVSCHNASDPMKIDLSPTLDAEKVPASYRTLIAQGWVHYLDCGYNSGGNEKREPLTFGTIKSKIWSVLDAEHHGVALTPDEKHRVTCWIDLNCPLWPDYQYRGNRPSVAPTAPGVASSQ
ncbi:MAG: hypothetical protein FJ297_12090 [Planctomycetes bacterium]|nr:hypothetical protein [Planctomycetota bacterium]